MRYLVFYRQIQKGSKKHRFREGQNNSILQALFVKYITCYGNEGIMSENAFLYACRNSEASFIGIILQIILSTQIHEKKKVEVVFALLEEKQILELCIYIKKITTYDLWMIYKTDLKFINIKHVQYKPSSVAKERTFDICYSAGLLMLI